MRSALYVALLAAPVGAADVIYYHLWKFRLYSRRQSLVENVTHMVRGAIFPLTILLLLFGRPEGAYYHVLLGLILVDSLNSFVDVFVEPKSRAPIGVPRSELVLHAVGLTASGAVLALVLTDWQAASLPTAYRPHPDGSLPAMVYAQGVLTVVAAALLSLFEASLFLRNRLRSGGDVTRPSG